ncbi:hypothetical protein KP509_11G007800 [Ceratopteris richardii]|uniref:pectinesterase n=1 Tax=Ceratopteris richardii TaxID=49495 RepID=A0A8T2TSL0_CERRI|nr:hypothetical protein KP509_11G007800 [Ceratopteris richardii]
MGSRLRLAALTLLFLTTISNVDPIRAANDGDDGAGDDDWLDRMGKTSSDENSQPGQFNTEHGRGTLEVDVGATAASAASPKTIIVAKDGSGHFKTVQAAVNSIPKSNKQRVIISIKAGIYKEKVQVDASWVTFQGAGPRLTEIQWGDTASTKGPDGELGTFKSASVAVNGEHFTARDISFRLIDVYCI